MLAITKAEIRSCGPKGIIPSGTVLVEGTKIVDLGADLGIPDGCRIIDASGMIVTPGFIDAHTHVGMDWQVIVGWGDPESNESSTINNAHLHAIDSVDPRDVQFRDAMEGGVTTIMIHCGGPTIRRQSLAPIPGLSVVMKTYGKFAAKEILREPAALKFALGEEVTQYLSNRKLGPNSRAGLIAWFRSVLVEARAYASNVNPLLVGQRDLRLEALARVLDGTLPLHIHAHRAIDIHGALRLTEEFGLRFVLQHATEGHLMAEELAERGVPCVVGPSTRARTGAGEAQGLSMKTPAILARAGVKVALMTDCPTEAVQYLPIIAGEAIREGMDPGEALKAVTINAAEIAGVADRVGSLAPGKDADIVIQDGDPLDATTHLCMVITGGDIAVDNLSH